jgi:hypothetical protein
MGEDAAGGYRDPRGDPGGGEARGLEFSESEQEAMLEGVNKNLARYQEIRSTSLPNEVPLPLYFNPRVSGESIDRIESFFRPSPPPRVERPTDLGKRRLLPSR